MSRHLLEWSLLHKRAPLDAVTVLTVLSLASLGSGGAFAWAACRLPPYTAALERCGGALLIAGLGLLGAALRSAQCLAESIALELAAQPLEEAGVARMLRQHPQSCLGCTACKVLGTSKETYTQSLSHPLILRTSGWRKGRSAKAKSLWKEILAAFAGFVCCFLAAPDSPA